MGEIRFSQPAIHAAWCVLAFACNCKGALPVLVFQLEAVSAIFLSVPYSVRGTSQYRGDQYEAPGRDTGLLFRRIFSPRGLDALQNRKAQEHNCTHCDPMRGDMQYHGSID
jgi:hypothetical protein